MLEHTHSFGYWLKRRRKALDLTQEQLANSVACSHFAIRKIEADERRPSVALAQRLAVRLGIPAAERKRFLAAARGTRGTAGLAVESSPIGTSPAVPEPPSQRLISGEPATSAQPKSGTHYVGRRAELAALDEALARAQAGEAQVVMLAGQPGMGKTRTAQEMAAHAAAAGMVVLWGRCPEEPGAPPYWPWVQLIRGYVDAHDRAEVVGALGAGAHWIADIVPEVGEGIARASAPASADAAQARFGLFDALASFWKRAAAERGIMMILDDLHWAEASSLRFLAFLAADAARARLFVFGTYRDIAVDRRHPLFDTLAELARLPNYSRRPLRGLSLEETRELVANAALTDASVTRLHEQTEGNPFYAREMARYLAAADAANGSATGLPAGVREAIGSRLNRLSADCNRVLAHAAVIGREFELTVLSGMAEELSEEVCVAAIEEALEANVIEEPTAAGAYRFSHALIRETLYDEISAIRRARLHFRVAAAIEAAHRHDLAGQLSRLAFHYGEAMAAQGADKALEFARRAGEHALELFAYEEAARHFRGALHALSMLERRTSLDPAQRCELLILQGEAQTFAADYSSARNTLRTAADLVMATGSNTDLARVAIAFEDASWRPGLSGEESISLLRSAFERIGDADLLLSAQVLSALTRALTFTGAAEEAFAMYERAVDSARRAGDAGALAAALCSGLSARWRRERLDVRLAAAREAIEIGQRIGDRGRVLEAMAWRLFDLMERGLDEVFWREYDEYVALSDETRQPFHLYTYASFRPALALMAGDLAASERYANELRAIGERQPGLDAGGVYATQMFTLRREQGRLRDLAPLVRHFVATTVDSARWRPGLALVFAELGMAEEARHEFEMLAADDFGGIARDAMWVACLAYLAEVCAFLNDVRRAPILYRMLLPYAERNLLAGTSVACFGAASRFLGMLAATEMRWNDAERHYRHAIEMNARQGAKTWLAHSQFEYARMLGARGDANDLPRIERLLGEASVAARALGLTALEARIGKAGNAGVAPRSE